MKVLFCFFPLFVAYNHGTALLSALCKAKGIETELCVLDDMADFRRSTIGPDWIAFSCVTVHDYTAALPYMEEARRIGCRTMLGGTYPRLGTCKDAPVDYVCEGEGETLPDFLLNGDDELFRKPLRYTNSLNDLPLPDYAMFDAIPFKRTDLLKGKVIPYYSSRGCPYACSFCQIEQQPKGVRIRANVCNDLMHLKEKWNPDVFFIGDELLPYYSEPWRESWGNFRHPFFAYIRADVPESILLWLIDRGMIACAFGIESGDEEYRNVRLNKRLKDRDIYRTVDILRAAGIDYAPFYMVNTPLETEEVREKTLKMMNMIGGYPFLWEYERLGAKAAA